MLMSLNLNKRSLMVVVGMAVILTSACSVLPRDDEADGSLMQTSFEEYTRVDRIRFSDILSWQPIEGGVWIEMSAPRQAYVLALNPSCYFELRQNLNFRISGASQRFISVGDDVVIGQSRCLIVAITPSNESMKLRGSFEKRN